ncbi:MAG: uracil-DNA glycosylase [Leptospiraceae bacterium]|nr:uracil-DNA glycosylase [Leptospiraceae bacterium]
MNKLPFSSYNAYYKNLENCRKCPNMIPPVIIGSHPKAKIISIGQAPGVHEKEKMKPFSYTAGKTLFKWISGIGVTEDEFRGKVNMSAVCRCFPGKAGSGDRKPDSEEIKNCSIYLKFEIMYHKPNLIIPIGKMAIDLVHENKKYKLDDVIGKKFRTSLYEHEFDWVALPHPSGLNVWNHSAKGKELLNQSLELIKNHPTFLEEFS